MSKKSGDPENRNGEASAEAGKPESGPQDKTYEVGYRMPPKHTRFVKGQSGNPRGRPRKAKPRPIKLSDAPSDFFLETEAYRLIELLEKGEKIELPTMQAVVRAMAVSALKGNRLSQKYFVEYVERQEERHLRYRVENYVRLETLKREGERTLAERERRGLPALDLLPHPDDIVLNPATGEARVAGPETPEDVPLYEHLVELRDLGLLHSAHASKRRGKAANRQDDSVCVYGVLAHLLDHFLPRRYRWQEGDAIRLMMEYHSLNRREREQRIAAGMAQLNATKPGPRLVTPELEQGIDHIAQRLRRLAG